MASGPQQRPALARQIGLSRLGVSELLAGLEVRGLVHVSGNFGGAPGRSQLSYALKSDAALVVGFDVGGTKVAGAVTDLRGQVLSEMAAATAQSGSKELIEQLGEMTDALCREAGVPRFRLRVGAVGVPAAVHPATAELSLAGNLRGLEGSNLRADLQTALGFDLLIDNDVNLALLGEVGQGEAQGCNNVAFIALGTGIGGALMVNGRLLRGAHGGAGELGYLPLWRIESAGTASLEEFVGEAGLRSAYVARGGDDNLSVKDIFSAAEGGDTAANAVLDEAADHVARAVLCVLSLLDPDLVVFGGSIGARPEFIGRVDRLVAASWMRPVRVVRSQSGSRAGLLGALELARNYVLDDMFGAMPRR